jgi:predicted transcriptional regulator
MKILEVPLTPEQATQLEQLASIAHKEPEQVARDLLIRTITEEARFQAAVDKGFAELDRGEFVTQEELEQRVERILRS